MFDPSKLDLDLNLEKTEENSELSDEKDNSLDKKDIKQSEEINDESKDNEKNDSGEKKSEIEKVDVLDLIDWKTIKKEKYIDPKDIWVTEYEKQIIKEKKEINNEKIKEEEKVENKIIYDINVTNIDNILSLLVDNEYDFATFEPTDENVKIIFRKNKVIKETKYIKHPIYSNILVKAKAITKLTIEETDNEQEWSWEKLINNTNHKIISKVVPTNSWAKLFIKAIAIEKKSSKKEKNKISLSTLLTYMWIIAFIALIIWGWFLGFIVMNAKSVEDVKFFASLWINLNDINSFALKAVTVIFSILIFIETAFLILYLLKFSIAKKEFKQKKIRYWIIALTIIIIAFVTGSIWMIIDKKIRSLPNWQEMANWDIQIFDNSKLLNEAFSKKWALLKDTSDLIWPIEIKFDLSFFAKKEEAKWLTIKKYTWDFWNDIIKETPIPTIIYNFQEKWTYDITLTLTEVDLEWKVIEKIVEDMPSINLSYYVDINEEKQKEWWKLVEFNATTLKELWQIEWYFTDNLESPIWPWNIFRVWEVIYDEKIVIMVIKDGQTKKSIREKIFIISSEEETALNWEITYTRSLINDLLYELQVENLTSDFWNWYIEEFKWVISDKEITKKWDPTEATESSKILYDFDWYGEHEITVYLKDSAWDIKEINTIIDIPRRLSLSKELKIYNQWEEVKNLEYDKKFNEYYINEIWIPTTLKLDAKFLKSDNLVYTLKKVDWDYDSNWDVDETNKEWFIDINKEWNHTITAHYYFVHRKIPDEIVKVTEKIYIEWIRKEAIINFDINKKSSYAPVTVSFDASKSQVKNENIEKFIWSYWDWIVEERDSIVPWHKYITAWDYKVKLTVITTNWKEYSISKDLILKPKPQNIEITTSMKKAPVWQWIDFSSDKSEWYIIWYIWNFWDNNISIKANPTHSYKKPWKYTVTLKLDFSNKNVLEKSIDLEIY